MRHGAAEALVFAAALLSIFAGTAIWAKFQPPSIQAPAATVKVPPAARTVPNEKGTFSLVAPAAAAEAKAKAGTGYSGKAQTKSKGDAATRHGPKSKNRNRSIATVPRAPTT